MDLIKVKINGFDWLYDSLNRYLFESENSRNFTAVSFLTDNEKLQIWKQLNY